MSLHCPVQSLKKRSKQSDCKKCFIHYSGSNNESFTVINEIENSGERFNFLKDVHKKRLQQPYGSVHRMQDVCSKFSEVSSLRELPNGFGYHRDCYRHFTRHLERLRPAPCHSRLDIENCSTVVREKRKSLEAFVFNPDCIFCGKEGRQKIKVRNVWTTEGTSYFEKGGGEDVKKTAVDKKDYKLVRRISCYDLHTCKACYHKSCKKDYMKSVTIAYENNGEKSVDAHKKAVHDKCFQVACDFIDKNVIQDQVIIPFKDVCDVYMNHLLQSDYPNPDYRFSKLKQRLIKSEKYNDILEFAKMERDGGKYTCDLLFSKKLDVTQAVRTSYNLAKRNNIKDVALYLRNHIQDELKSSMPIPWPPSASYLSKVSVEDIVPKHLQEFLTVLLSGDSDKSVCAQKTQRLVSSFGQDICRGVTDGKWKMPKHLLLGMTVRHMFRSSQLNTLLNRFGHAECYSFILELETALANAIQENSSVIAVSIVRNPNVPSVFVSDFDNFDQLTNEVTGKRSVHTAHGIMLQSFEGDMPVEFDTTCMPKRQKTGERSFQNFHDYCIDPVYVSNRLDPVLQISEWTRHDAGNTVHNACIRNFLWVVLRDASKSDQCIPGWAGFVSQTGVAPKSLTTIDYYPVINQPITEYSTIQECLSAAEKATNEIGQEYIITGFDLGVCMKAYPLVWQNPDKYKQHIILIGTFHIICAYFHMVGKKMEGSGLCEIFVEAGLITNGSLSGVMNGKNYSRALNCHKALLEGLERLLFEEFLRHEECGRLFDEVSNEKSISVLEDLEYAVNRESFFVAMADENIVEYIEKYIAFRSAVKEGLLGKTAKFWVSYMDHIWLILQTIEAVKSNNFDLYNACLFKMADIFFAFGGQNYARYLTYFSLFLTNIEKTHPRAEELIRRGGIGVARSFIPGNLCAIDKTIEETFMKHAKSKGGVGGISMNESTYQRWARTAHERALYVQSTLSMADMLDESYEGRKHRETRPSSIIKSEKAVEQAIDGVKSFFNPFTEAESKDRLYCLSSGVPVSDEIEKDVLLSEKIGKDQKEIFIKDRLEVGKHFFDPIRRLNLKRMNNSKKTTAVKTSNNKLVEYKQEISVTVQLLVKLNESKPEIIEEIMKYPLTAVPYSLGTADGKMNQTNKAKGFSFLTQGQQNAVLKQNESVLVIIDGNASLHEMRDVPATFGDISHRIFTTVMGKDTNVIFSTDFYYPESIKSAERASRGVGEKRIIKGLSTKKPESWSEFMTNDENKQQLINLLHDHWKTKAFEEKLRGKSVVVTREDSVLKYSNDNNEIIINSLDDLVSSHEETDSRVILYCKFAEEQGFDTVKVRSQDSDIFFLLVYYSHSLNIRILLDVGHGKQRRLLDISEFAEMQSKEHSSALLGLHAYTRCDTTSAFRGIGKVSPIRVLQKKSKFQPVLAQLGEEWTMDEKYSDQLEEFTCSFYPKAYTCKKTDLMRYKIINKKCGNKNKIDVTKAIDLASMPPPQRCLVEHMKRANYQVAIWKRSHLPKPYIPDPTDNHGWLYGENGLEPNWCDGEIVPPEFGDLLEELEENPESDEEVAMASDTDISDDDDDDDTLYSIA